MIPQNDDKAVLYLKKTARTSVNGRAPVVSHNGQDVQRVPIVSIRQIVVFGNVQVSTQALQTLVQAEVPVVYLNTYGKFIATVLPAPPKNVSLAGGPVPDLRQPISGADLGAGGSRGQDRQPANAAHAIVAVATACRGRANGGLDGSRITASDAGQRRHSVGQAVA